MTTIRAHRTLDLCFHRTVGRIALGAVVLLAVAGHAWASGSGTAMPWETPLQSIADSITGPVAKAIGVLAIAITGLGISIVFGLAIAFTASSFALTFFNFTGGAGF
jgi:type IV secretory pathway VirB2 component (pilin)